MLHPSYTEILERINDNEDNPTVESRYSIVIATSKRAREIIAGDAPFVPSKENDKPLSIAVKELAAEGIIIDKDHPIYLDLPVFTGSEVYANRGEALKQSVENVSGGFIVINKVDCPTSADWYYAGYYYSTGNEANFDICDLSGWGPDYGDPQTYLDTMQPEYAGYMVKALGVF